MPILNRLNLTAKELAMACEFDPAATHASAQIIITLSALALFVGTKTVVNRIRKEFTELTVVVVGCGPIGLTAALIAAHSSKVKRIILYEELSKTAVENATYQIAILPSVVSFLRSYSIDFDNLEGLWHSGSFYTRVGIYLEYIISILHLYKPEIVMKFSTKSGHVWGNTLIKYPSPVSPTEWGWQQTSPDAAPTPVYTTTPTISRDLPQLVICQCKTDCKVPCKCCVQGQSCMFLCRCQGSCSHTVAMRAAQTH